MFYRKVLLLFFRQQHILIPCVPETSLLAIPWTKSKPPGWNHQLLSSFFCFHKKQKTKRWKWSQNIYIFVVSQFFFNLVKPLPKAEKLSQSFIPTKKKNPKINFSLFELSLGKISFTIDNLAFYSTNQYNKIKVPKQKQQKQQNHQTVTQTVTLIYWKKICPSEYLPSFLPLTFPLDQKRKDLKSSPMAKKRNIRLSINAIQTHMEGSAGLCKTILPKWTTF